MKTKINIFGPINNLGVGTHCLNFARALEKQGMEICLIPPFGGVGFRDGQIDRWISNRDSFSKNDPSLMIFDIDFLTQFTGSPRIGFAVFETDSFTPIQEAAIGSCDMILTPSEWGRCILSLHGFDSNVVNEGYDPQQFKEVTEENKGKFKFCHVGKFETRKGTMDVLQGFLDALEKEDAILELRCENRFHQDWSNDIYYWMQSREFNTYGVGISGNPIWSSWRRMGLEIKIMSSQFENLSGLYAGSDCGIFPSKGEGWGLPIQECVVSGTPAIVGNWTGQSEYLSDSYPKELTLQKMTREIANDGIWYHGDRGNWNVPDNDELVEKIKWAYNNARIFRQSTKWKTEVERIRKFTWDAAAGQFIKLLYK